MKKARQDKDEESAADLLKAYVGEDVAGIIRELSQKKGYSEFKLAEAVGKEVNETRNLLYKLYNYNLASFIKKKDNKVGWYIHYWTFHEDRVNAFLLGEKKSRLESLKELVSKESRGSLFSCANACVGVDFDRAFELSFRCPECGELLNQENNPDRVKDWLKEIGELEKDIGFLERQKTAKSAERLTENTRLDELEKEVKKSRK
ncbi:hypothetical protein HYU40_01030 [Candidatus Woesearchaeota archaeon]|nr:hypothetical protein [Candidatus Woesearchaeota archaeon]